MSIPISFILIALITDKGNKSEIIKSLKLPNHIKTKIMILKSAEQVIEEAKKLGVSHIAIINGDEKIDSNWLINQINFYENCTKDTICNGISYKCYKKDYPNFISNNRILNIITRKNLIKVKDNFKNVFLSIENYNNLDAVIVTNYNSVSYKLINNLPIPILIINYFLFINKLHNTVKSKLKHWYKHKTGNILNLINPRTYNEKIQWMKLYDSTSTKTKLADKYLVREWVKEKIGEEYLIPLLGVWDNFDDIDFDKLPNKFVLKCNHGCAYNIIVKNKDKLNKEKTRKKIEKWLKKDYGMRGYELHYSNIPRKIIAEEYIENANSDLYDYKVWCFNGKAHYIQFLSERNTKGLKMAFYDRNWNKQNFAYSHPLDEKTVQKPKGLKILLELAEKLSKGFNHVRVDFYITNSGKIYFGEMTFTSCSGI